MEVRFRNASSVGLGDLVAETFTHKIIYTANLSMNPSIIYYAAFFKVNFIAASLASFNSVEDKAQPQCAA